MNEKYKRFARPVVTLALLAGAIAGGLFIWNYYTQRPWTRDGRVRADVVQVAPDIAGLVTSVAVTDNQDVKAGQILFQLDRARFALALRQSEAAIREQRVALAQAVREARRDRAAGELVAGEVREQSQARVAQLSVALEQASITRDVARVNLARSTVRAVVDGQITNLVLQAGNYVAAGTPAMALVNAHSFRVEGYFEETKVPLIRVGDRAFVRLMGSDHDLAGRVVSISSGIADRDRTSSGNLLTNINPTFNWVRLAQRIPVTVKLDPVPTGERLISGTTASVTVRPVAVGGTAQ